MFTETCISNLTSFFYCSALNISAMPQSLQEVLLSFNIRIEIQIACSTLQETLNKHNEDTVDNSLEAIEESLAGTDTEENGNGGCLKLFKNWPLMSAITLYCIFSLQDVAYAEVKLPLVG